MARMARVVLAGYPHHVVQRGVRRIAIFSSDDDRSQYLRLLAEESRRSGLQFLSYCLMTNHIHLVAIPEREEGLARGIGEAHRRYTRMINFREKVRGYLFQGRFSSCSLDECHLLAAVRYVENNPVRAGIVRRAWEYRWSSAAFHVGRRKSDLLLSDRGCLGLVNEWKEFLMEAVYEEEFLRESTRTGRPCGGEDFVREAERLTSRRLRRLKPWGERLRKAE